MGNYHALEIGRIDTIKLKMHDGTIYTIKEVQHAKGLMKNLLSLGQLEEVGYKIHIENGIMKAVRGLPFILKEKKDYCKLIYVLGELMQEEDASVVSTSSGKEYYNMASKIETYDRTRIEDTC